MTFNNAFYYQSTVWNSGSYISHRTTKSFVLFLKGKEAFNHCTIFNFYGFTHNRLEAMNSEIDADFEGKESLLRKGLLS